METGELMRSLDAEGRLLADAAREAGFDAEVPTCPGWQISDLLRHTGMVHRWATTLVAEGHTSYHPDGGLPDLYGELLLAWFRDGHARLVDTLSTAPADLECWAFMPAPSPLAFWVRRQAHETTIHRVDAETARGNTPTTIAAGFAADGIDELLRGFHARSKSRVRTDAPRTLRVRATDTGAVWTVRLSADAPVTERGESGDADCELAGPAARLYLALWNRLPFPDITGDPELAALWRERSGITWS
ncbi:maleylpyruvate isomerase family mycothiol-dependent enzyme [Streptomyces sp. NPDC091292]|uniref:maleylpyruvate isomerase family mycothiol-dependent enzyme n=1 Tax=Streptomyces sp. NPDC091292 TaxID=3365991 RepID=UPI00380A7E27